MRNEDELPSGWNKKIRRISALSEAEDGFVNVSLPHSDLRYVWLPEDSPYEYAWRYTSLPRTAGVPTLGSITYRDRSKPRQRYFFPFGQHREGHQYLVGLVAQTIAQNNFLREEEVTLATVAGLIHDNATPAGGDAIKKMDPKNLHEELHWKESIDERGWEYFRELGITEDILDATIKNRGLVGKILDVADRIVYVMMDINQIISNSRAFAGDDYLADLYNLIAPMPLLGNIYQDVKVDRRTRDIFFENPDRLRRFLQTRVLMHRNCYLDPVSQARDQVFTNLTSELYSPDGTKLLSPQLLRRMRDSDLIEVLREEYDLSKVWQFSDSYFSLYNWYPRYHRFEDADQARKLGIALSRYPDNFVVLGVNRIPKISTGVHYKVRSRSGDLIPFSEYDPQTSQQLEVMAEEISGHYVLFQDRKHPLKGIGDLGNYTIDYITQKTNAVRWKP